MLLPDTITNLSLGDILLAVSTVGGAVVGWVKRNTWVIDPLKRVWTRLASLCPKNENGAKLDLLLKEFRPNGGSSFKDAITRVENAVSLQSEKLLFLQKRSEKRDELNNVANFTTNERGECIAVNKPYLNLCGLSETEVLGNGWANVIADSDREYVFKEWFDAIEHKRDFHLRFKYKNNANDTTLPVKVDAFIVKDGEKIIGWLGYVRKLEDLSATQKL